MGRGPRPARSPAGSGVQAFPPVAQPAMWVKRLESDTSLTACTRPGRRFCRPAREARFAEEHCMRQLWRWQLSTGAAAVVCAALLAQGGVAAAGTAAVGARGGAQVAVARQARAVSARAVSARAVTARGAPAVTAWHRVKKTL